MDGGQAMTLDQMRDYIRQYSSDQFYEKVKRMPDNQVIAIYFRLVDKHNKHRRAVQSR